MKRQDATDARNGKSTDWRPTSSSERHFFQAAYLGPSDVSESLAYGATADEAVGAAKALALRVLADRIEKGDQFDTVTFHSAA